MEKTNHQYFLKEVYLTSANEQRNFQFRKFMYIVFARKRSRKCTIFTLDHMLAQLKICKQNELTAYISTQPLLMIPLSFHHKTEELLRSERSLLALGYVLASLMRHLVLQGTCIFLKCFALQFEIDYKNMCMCLWPQITRCNNEKKYNSVNYYQ